MGHHRGRKSLTLVVSDGCGSAPASELGALFACRWVERFASERDAQPARSFASELGRQLPAAVEALARSLTPQGEDLATTLEQSFLFTLLVARLDLVSGALTIFGCGDGVVVVDDNVFEVGRNPDNAPDYIAYRVLNPSRGAVTIFHEQEGASAAMVAVATDGASSLLGDGVVSTEATGGQSVRPLGEWLHALPHHNPSLLQKRLAALAAVPHLLHDDTSIALARRSPELGEPT